MVVGGVCFCLLFVQGVRTEDKEDGGKVTDRQNRVLGHSLRIVNGDETVHVRSP